MDALFLIFAALGQVMLYVDGMNGVIEHPETIQWLYGLIASEVSKTPALNRVTLVHFF